MPPRLLVILTLAVLVTACTNEGQPRQDGATSTRSTTSTPLPTRLGSGAPMISTSLKAPIAGLLDRDGRPPEAYLGTAVSGWVIDASWAQVQPVRGGELAAHNPIDAAIAEVRVLNTAHPDWHLALKLRLRSGKDAPAWAKALGGAAVSITEPQSGAPATIGRFWTPEYAVAYAELQRKLAARYDAEPELREVVMSQCTTFFAEPFIRDKGDKPSVAALLGAGLSTAADSRCLYSMIDAHAVWTKTRSDLAVNPYQDLQQKGRGQGSELTQTVMKRCRQTLGPRCVLENNSLSKPPKYPDLYAQMTELGAPLAFQTASGRRVGDLAGTLAYARQLRAGSVELPISYRKTEPAMLRAAKASFDPS